MAPVFFTEGPGEQSQCWFQDSLLNNGKPAALAVSRGSVTLAGHRKHRSPRKRTLRVEMWAGSWEKCPRRLENGGGHRGKEEALAGEVKRSSVRSARRWVGV